MVQAMKKVVSLKECIQVVLAVVEFSVELDYQLARDLCAAVVESCSLVLDCPLDHVFCGGTMSSVSGKVAQSRKRTVVTPGVGGGMLGGGGQPVGMLISYGGGSVLTGGGQPEAGNLFGTSGRQKECVRPSNEVATIASGKMAVSSGPSYQRVQKDGWGEGEPWVTHAALGGGMLGRTGGDKTASVALTSWGGGKEMMGGGQQGAGSLFSSGGGGREGHYCGQHHGAGQEGQQHCGGPGAAGGPGGRPNGAEENPWYPQWAETIRSVELLPLTEEGDGPVVIGDWIVQVTPLMEDMSSQSAA